MPRRPGRMFEYSYVAANRFNEQLGGLPDGSNAATVSRLLGCSHRRVVQQQQQQQQQDIISRAFQRLSNESRKQKEKVASPTHVQIDFVAPRIFSTQTFPTVVPPATDQINNGGHTLARAIPP